MASIFCASALDGMSGRETTTSLPLLSVVCSILMMPTLSRSFRYDQNWVCFLGVIPYSSQTMWYVFSTWAADTEGLSLIALAVARTTAIFPVLRDLSLVSDIELYIMALAALTCSIVTSPSTSSSARFAARSSSSIATLASPYSDACSAIRSKASDVILPGCRASSALASTISLSSLLL